MLYQWLRTSIKTRKMKNNNLELELRKVEFSVPNDKIPFEQHSYNGILGSEGVDVYYRLLDNLYVSYFAELRLNIDSIITNQNNQLNNFLNSKILLFNDIRDDYFLKNYLDYNSLISGYEQDIKAGNNNPNLKNEYDTVKFFAEMSSMQLSFIEKAIDELEKIYKIYNSENEPIKTKTPINIRDWSIPEYVDNYFVVYSDKDTLTNYDLERIFGKTRMTINNWKNEGRLTQVSEENKRPILYSKDDVKNSIKNGVLPHRLTDIKNK